MGLRLLLHYIYLLPAAFFAPVIHESVKALCSARLGDPTPRKKGFLTGNPFRYFEPVGFFCILIFGYGWGQPTPTAPVYYKDRKRGVLITYITPSVINLLAGVIAAALGRLLTVLTPIWLGASPPAWVATIVFAVLDMLEIFAVCNVGLALFNIIPVFPLDGAKILQLYLSPDMALRMNHYEKIFQVILLVCLGFGFVGTVLNPLSSAIVGLIL